MKNPVNLKDFISSAIRRRHFITWPLKLIIAAVSLNGPVLLAQVGVHTDFPDASSAMDITATNKGLLIPRVTLSENLDDPSPVSAPAVGLLVFNSGPNQEMGFYYWDGAFWVPVGSGGSSSGDAWLLTGNSGTEAGTNFLGTTDPQDLAVYTNATERMRVMANGQVVIDSTAARFPSAMFTVFGNATQNSAIHAYSSGISIYAIGGTHGVNTRVNNATGWPLYAKNLNASGYGAMTVGSNYASAGYFVGRSAGLNSWGNDGIHAYGSVAATGIGVMAAGNALTPIVLAEGAGGTFRGYWALYGRSSSNTGTGIIGVGNNQSQSFYMPNGCGGAFTGNDGLLGHSQNASSNGTGVIGAGNNILNPITIVGGSGGAFSGTSVGAGAWGGANGLIGWGQLAATGIGVVGAGNNLAAPTLAGGGGGAFSGTGIGSASWASAATGTGILGAGNNVSANLYAGIGSGGAFTGTLAGAVAWGTDATNGTGVIGSGNNVAPTVIAGGSGGAFTGYSCGVYGNATNTGNLRYGGYFATTNGQYAYVGGRSNNTNQKIIGTGTVSTIVKNSRGDLLTLTCPEAPEVVFQDFGTGQLVEGKAHITIDPDLALNISVTDKHPLKVYITPEGDCNGVYVTNKSVNGFDVIELQGGKSNVPFSWQIVATRANEEYKLKDGSVEVSDYSKRFPPAPGPLEMTEQPSNPVNSVSSNASGNNQIITEQKDLGVLKEQQEGKVITIPDEPDGN